MIRGVCLAICVFGFLLGDATVARADHHRGEPDNRRFTIPAVTVP